MEKQLREPEKAAIVTASVEEFLAALEPETVVIEVPEMGPGKGFRVKSLSIDDREKIRSACTDRLTGKLNVDQFQVQTILHCAVEPKLSPEHIAALRRGNVKILDRLANGIFELGKLNETEEQAKKE